MRDLRNEGDLYCKLLFVDIGCKERSHRNSDSDSDYDDIEMEAESFQEVFSVLLPFGGEVAKLL